MKRAIELNPNYATAYHWLSLILRSEGKLVEAYTNIMRAHELDPLSRVIGVNIGEVLYANGKINEAIRQFEKIIEENPDYAFAYIWLGSRKKELVDAISEATAKSYSGARDFFKGK